MRVLACCVNVTQKSNNDESNSSKRELRLRRHVHNHAVGNSVLVDCGSQWWLRFSSSSFSMFVRVCENGEVWLLSRGWYNSIAMGDNINLCHKHKYKMQNRFCCITREGQARDEKSMFLFCLLVVVLCWGWVCEAPAERRWQKEHEVWSVLVHRSLFVYDFFFCCWKTASTKLGRGPGNNCNDALDKTMFSIKQKKPLRYI